MKRKAKREGLAADHYLRIGAAPPTKAEIDGLKALPKEQAMALWKKTMHSIAMTSILTSMDAYAIEHVHFYTRSSLRILHPTRNWKFTVKL